MLSIGIELLGVNQRIIKGDFIALSRKIRSQCFARAAGVLTEYQYIYREEPSFV